MVDARGGNGAIKTQTLLPKPYLPGLGLPQQFSLYKRLQSGRVEDVQRWQRQEQKAQLTLINEVKNLQGWCSTEAGAKKKPLLLFLVPPPPHSRGKWSTVEDTMSMSR